MKTILVIISICIGLIITQKNMYDSNIEELEKAYETKISLISKKGQSQEKEKNPLADKIELTNILIEDFQDDSLLKFNKNTELNQLILNKNNEILEVIKLIKEGKCK